MEVQTTAIENFIPSSSMQLSSALLGIENALEAAARYNVEQAGDDFLDAEKEAMTVIEELRLINGMDLAAVLLRGKLLRRIEETSMWSYHPARYGSLEEMANDQGISVSNLSNIRDLTFVIFPWMASKGMSIPEKWEQIGISKFRELIPVLKVMITGQPSATQSVQGSVDAILNDTAATLRAANPNREISEEEIRDTAIDDLLTAGELLRSRELRARIRPTRTPNINMDTYMTNEGTRIIIAELSEDQWTMFNRLLGQHVDNITVDYAFDARVRQREIMTRPIMRKLTSMVSG